MKRTPASIKRTALPIKSPSKILQLILAVLLAAVVTATAARAEITEREYRAFTSEMSVTLPGTPDEIFDAATGDISGWWDHSFSENPAKLYIEPRPGGGFYEIFDDSGAGVRHAVVTAAQRGKLLRFEGPLGFAGHAIHIVTTYDFTPVGTDSTKLAVTVNAAGQYRDGWSDALDRVWQHFIGDRFKSYVESGGHKKRP